MVGKLKLGNQFRQLLLHSREGLKKSAIFGGGKGAGTHSAKHFCIAIVSSSAMFTGLCALPADAQGTPTDSMATEPQLLDTKQYSPIEITYLKPEEILPIVGQVEVGDEDVYKYIEHLRIAENVMIDNMQRKYGTGHNSAEEYRALRGRVHIGMAFEEPIGYDNYELIGGGNIAYRQPSDHATHERRIVNSIINNANFIVQNGGNPWRRVIKEPVDANPNNIYVFGNSNHASSNKEWRLTQNSENLKQNLARSKNFLIFAAGTNIIRKHCIYHEDIDGDESGEYSLPSAANGSENKDPNNHIVVTVGTNKKGDVDQTYGSYGASKFPVGFHDKSLFAGRRFPYRDNDYSGRVVGQSDRCATSYPNYLNVAMTGLIAQNFADIYDVDELLEMMRSTADTDYIRLDLNGDGDTDDIVQVKTDDGYIDQPESQPLQLISPGAVFRKYGMAINEAEGKRPSIQMPTEIASGQVSSLEKGWYKGVVFLFPGTEVLVEGEWIPFDNDNFEATIKNCNPFHLEFRMNGDLLVQQGFKVGDAIEGTIQAVDDQWGGLKDISKPFTLTLTDNPDSIGTLAAGNPSMKSSWYTISGQKLSKRPTKPGIYIHNGKKVVIQ